MSYTQHAELDLEPDEKYPDTLSLGTFDNDQQTGLVFEGPAGLETVIRFNHATIKRNQIVFTLTSGSRHHDQREVGSIEASQAVVNFIWNAVIQHVALTYTVQCPTEAWDTEN